MELQAKWQWDLSPMCAAYNQMGEFIEMSSRSWGGGETENKSGIGWRRGGGHMIRFQKQDVAPAKPPPPPSLLAIHPTTTTSH